MNEVAATQFTALVKSVARCSQKRALLIESRIVASYGPLADMTVHAFEMAVRTEKAALAVEAGK